MAEEITELTAEQLANDLGLGIDLSEEDRAQASEMYEALQRRYGFVDEDAPAEEPANEPPQEEQQEPQEGEGEPEPTPEAPSPAPVERTTVTIDGREIPLAEVSSLLELRNYLTAHPEQAQRLYTPPAPEPEPEPVVPEWVDQDDPFQVGIWKQLQAQNDGLRQTAERTNEILAAQASNRARQEVAAGFEAFKAAHPELSEADVTTVRLAAVATYPIDAMAAMTGPDGLPVGAEKATLNALDAAYLTHPEFQARARNESAELRTAATERKQKLSALGSSSGSAPRSQPAPDLTSDKAAHSAAADFLRNEIPGLR